MTKQQAEDIFRKAFEGTYKVEDFKGPFRDFVVVKNPFTGVALKLEQTGSETKLVYAGVAPAFWARLILGSLIGFPSGTASPKKSKPSSTPHPTSPRPQASLARKEQPQ